MAKVYTHPHWETNVIDYSTYNALVRETLPLFRPIFFMRAQSGPVGIPVFCSTYNNAVSVFGEGTFEENTEYFSREALYLNRLFARQGAFIVRLASEEAKVGSVVLELQVKNTQVTQYERDTYGQYSLDPDTLERIPLKDASTGAEVTEEGLELKWIVREMADGETLANLKPTSYGTGANAYTIYPMIAAKATSVGAYSNDTGFKFFFDGDNLDDTMATNLGSIPYMFGAVKKTYGQDTVSPIRSNFQNIFEGFVAKENQTDERTARNVSFDDVISNYYTNVLPWDIKVFSENFKIVGELVQLVEPDVESIQADPYLVNLTDNYDMYGLPMPHVVFSEDSDSVMLDNSRIIYLQGGKNGDISDESIEELTRQYLKDDIYPEIYEQPRYPFTHIIDTGVAIETKKAFIQFLGKHDAHKVVLSTQNANLGRWNTKNEDQSTGSALFSACLLQPESIVYGTECCRAEIYQQCGHLADSTYRGIIPSTLDVMLKKSRFQSTQSIMGHAAGLPLSEITIFKDWNWTPCDPDHRQRVWDSGLNYFQFYDMTSIHWPAMRTVYRYDTSVLTSTLFTDVVVYTKHIARYNWSRFAGVEWEFSVLAAKATDAVNNDLRVMLNGLYNFSVNFYQTEEEAKIGYISHARIQLWGNPQQRVWVIDIECYRNGYDMSAEA